MGELFDPLIMWDFSLSSVNFTLSAAELCPYHCEFFLHFFLKITFFTEDNVSNNIFSINEGKNPAAFIAVVLSPPPRKNIPKCYTHLLVIKLPAGWLSRNYVGKDDNSNDRHLEFPMTQGFREDGCSSWTFQWEFSNVGTHWQTSDELSSKWHTLFRKYGQFVWQKVSNPFLKKLLADNSHVKLSTARMMTLNSNSSEPHMTINLNSPKTTLIALNLSSPRPH